MNVSMFQWSLRTATARPMRPLAISPVCKKVAPSRLLKPQAVLETRPSKVDKDMLKLAKKQEKAVAKVKKAEMKAARKAAEDRGALYFLHWHNVSPSTVIPPETAATKGCTAQTQKYIATLQEELKRMEDVSEDALWYVTKEAEDGMHVLLVTGHAKDGLKYGLQELPAEAETHSVQLGAAGEMVIPVASLRALLMKQRAEEMMDSSDEEEEVAPGGMMPAAVGVALMDDAKQQKKMLKQEEKRMKEEEKRMKKEKKMGMTAAVKESMAMVEDSDSDSNSEDEDCMGATSVCLDAKQGVSGLGEVVATGVVEEDPVAREHARQLLGQMGSKVDAKMTKMEKAEEEDSGSCSDEDSSESSSESDSETMEDEGKVGTAKEQQRVSVA